MSIDRRRGQFTELAGISRRDARDSLPGTPIYFHERPPNRPMAEEFGEPVLGSGYRKSKLPKNFGLRKF